MAETRERWLKNAANALAIKVFAAQQALVPFFRVSVGFPKGGRGKAIGQCWSAKNSNDAHCEIFISPKLDNAEEVISTLAHELVHASIGLDKNHGPVFRKLAKAIGLEGKMTATIAGEMFKQAVKPILADLGPYPHAALSPGTATRKKAGTRLIKAWCPECGYTVRLSRKWIEHGLPICPSDQTSFIN